MITNFYKCKMRNTPENIEIRREKVKLLLSLGFPQSEIARQLKYSLRTIVSDVNYIRREWSKQIKNIDLEQLISEMKFETKHRIKELYSMIQRSTRIVQEGDQRILIQGIKDRDKISAIRVVGDETERIVRLLQSVGIIHKEPESFEMTGKIYQFSEDFVPKDKRQPKKKKKAKNKK